LILTFIKTNGEQFIGLLSGKLGDISSHCLNLEQEQFFPLK